MLQSVTKGNVDHIIQSINSGYDISANNYELLRCAIDHDNMSMIKLLLTSTDYVKDEYILQSICRLAIIYNDLELLYYLFQNYELKSPGIIIGWACTYGTVETIDFLLNMGLKINMRDLMLCAIRSNKIEIVTYLVNLNIGIDDRDYELIVKTAFSLNIPMLSTLLESSSCNFTKYDDLINVFINYRNITQSESYDAIIDYISTAKLLNEINRQMANLSLN